jgi:disulfide bond formation protein DsbB
MALKKVWKTFNASPVDALFRWQNQRFLWLLMSVAMGGLVLVAHGFFQLYLYMAPCEQCVYIRFAMLVMVAGGLIATVNPEIVALKLVGGVAAFYGAVTGIMYSLKLNKIHQAVHDPDGLFGAQGCSASPQIPLGLPLEKWAPEWFCPTGDCGFDAPIVPEGAPLDGVQTWFTDTYVASEGWYLIPSLKFLNMAQACFLAFSLVLVVLAVMSIVWGIKIARR